MKRLADTFKAGGFAFKLVKRTGDVAIFEKRKKTHTRSFWEVVLVQKHPRHLFPNGKVAEAREAMPSSEKWGTAGWSYSDPDDAEDHFQKLITSTP